MTESGNMGTLKAKAWMYFGFNCISLAEEELKTYACKIQNWAVRLGDLTTQQ
jgi:hypothetical protein